ncbi:hypothetical protein PV327_001592 [Microctonus hyperodae]|uniref:Glycosyltransferase family 92 protein n=1 Tax=Microctonus hyperodae TaxID=165561 RepID=A0AA39FDX2_MICHY|nr:hypothetical protein PV327_001592 [Microctonus hyperodae]
MGTRRAGFGLTITNGNASVTGSSNLNFSRSNAGILKDRANMSFMLVIMFFAVFGLIVLTEIFLIDERRGINGRTNVHGGSHPNSLHRLVPMPDRPDYEEVAGDFADEYISFKAVSIVARLRASPTNRIHIQNRPQDRPVERQNLAICVKPLHFNYNRVLQLVEFIELYKILGANHVILYNDTIGDETGCTLEYYEKTRGLVSLLPWHGLDMISQREIRTEALFAALNDCLYRSMYKYEYVALVDLDEFIIPRHNDTIIQLIRWMTSRISSKSTSALSFQNAFFYLQWPDDPLITIAKSPTQAGLVTLRKTRRRLKLHPHKQRSKYICKPRDIVEAGNHFVWEFLAGHGTLNVPSDAAILHHYRVCEFGGDDCVKTPSVVDKTAYKYKKQLTNDVDESWLELGKICRLPQLEPISRQLPERRRHPLFKPNSLLNDMKTQRYSVDFLTNPSRIV